MKYIFKAVSASWPFFLGLIIGLFFFSFEVIGRYFTHFPGDLGDGRFNNYILEHVYQFFIGNASFWNAPFMYPEPMMITFSDNLSGSAPIYAIFRILGFDRETAYQYWFIIVAALNYTCCYLLLQWLFKNKYASVIGAMIFAFSLALQSQMSHAQTFPRFAIPLAIWFALLFHKNLSPKYFFFTLFFLVYQFYCGIYLGFMLSVPLAVIIVLSFNKNWDKFKILISNKKWKYRMMGSLIINAILLLFLMIPYFIRSLSLGFNKYINIVDTIPTIKSFFYSQIGTPCWDWLSNVGRGYPAWWDHQIFTGAIATLSLVFLIIFMIRKYYTDKSYLKSNETITLLVIAAIFTFALFTRFRGFSLYYLIHFIPGMSSMRSLTRIINIELLFFAIAGAFTFSKIIKQKKIWAAPVFILCLGLFVVDNYNNSPYHTPVEETQKRVNALTARMVHIPKGSIMSYEPTNKEGSATSSLQIDAMLAAQTLNLKTVNGYSATSAKGYGDFWFNLDSASRVKYFSEAGYTPDTVYVVK